MSYTLSDLQHGKAEVRVVKVDRGLPEDPERHVLHDLNVTTQLRGDFAPAYTDGDNSHVHATDTQKNTVYALAREHGVTSPETFLTTLAEHWLAQPFVTGIDLAAELYTWERLPQNGHSFVRSGQDTRLAYLARDGESLTVRAGLKDLVVLKSTGSEFHGFPRDRYTTLAETDDRILATSVSAEWTYSADAAGTDFDAAYASIREAMLGAFAGTHSLALQQTIHAMATAALDAVPEVASIHIACPNRHHFLVDLSPFGLDNPGEVFFAADRPYGLISATVTR
jgi:urate oxidase